MGNRYHQWLSDIELIQISAFFSLLFLDKTQFHCCKANRGLQLLRSSARTPEKDHFHIYSLGFKVGEKHAPFILILIITDSLHMSCALLTRFYIFAACGRPLYSSKTYVRSFHMLLTFGRNWVLSREGDDFFPHPGRPVELGHGERRERWRTWNILRMNWTNDD